jgi:hypothetical protein
MKLISPTAFLLTICLLFFPGSKMIAQDKTTPDSFYHKAVANSIALHHHAFGKGSSLYNGSRYPAFPFRFKEGHPFFNSAVPSYGAVTYDGTRYDSVLMRYDEVREVLLIGLQAENIQLVSPKVDSFELFDASFVRLTKDSTNDALPGTGFYQVLYRGRSTLLKKQVKTVREVLGINELLMYVDTKQHYYISLNDQVYGVNNKHAFFDLLGQRKKEVQQFIKANQLNFQKDREEFLVKATAYYDSLIQ